MRWAYNASPSTGRGGFSPNELVFGRQLRDPLTTNLVGGLVWTSAEEAAVRSLRGVKEAAVQVERYVQAARAIQAKYHNQGRQEVEFKIGSKCMIEIVIRSSKTAARTFFPRWAPNWQVIEKLSPNLYKLQKGDVTRIQNVCRMRPQPEGMRFEDRQEVDAKSRSPAVRVEAKQELKDVPMRKLEDLVEGDIVLIKTDSKV
jgi:hypothetical protein